MKTKNKEAERGREETGPGTAPAQGLWSGTISFSLVAIPVRLVKAVEPGRVAFNLLHDKDYSPLKREMFCPDEEKIVPHGEIVRGFELEPGRHVQVTEEELEAAAPERSRTIEIAEFIDLDEVDPVYYDHPYFLAPLKGGEKAYRLLAEAMKRTNKAGVAKFVLGEREYLVTVRSKDGALALSTLHYTDEILSDADFAPGPRAHDDGEKERIKKRVKEMMTGFTPEKYSDGRRRRLLELLKKKAKGKAWVEAPEVEEEPAEGVEDLVAALEESMRRIKHNR